MKVKWKRIKMPAPFCGDCGSQLWGNNSKINPYSCPCGIWEATPQDPFTFSLKKDARQI